MSAIIDKQNCEMTRRRIKDRRYRTQAPRGTGRERRGQRETGMKAGGERVRTNCSGKKSRGGLGVPMSH